jgi:hypothetical protein
MKKANALDGQLLAELDDELDENILKSVEPRPITPERLGNEEALLNVPVDEISGDNWHIPLVTDPVACVKPLSAITETEPLSIPSVPEKEFNNTI